VVAVGGTSLALNPLDFAAPYGSEQGWSDSGGGTSNVETEPAYQEGVQTNGFRTIPDVSFDANLTTGVAVYDSDNPNDIVPPPSPWLQMGGTSLSASCWAGLIAIADQGRVAGGGTTLDGPSQTLPALYSLPASDFHDGLGGDNGTNTDGLSNPATYDEVTGLGTPQANVLVYDLASYQWDNQLVVSSEPTFPPSSVLAGENFGLTVTVENRFGNVETRFNGDISVAFGSNPGGGPLRGTLIAAATNGVAVFSGLSINTAGTGYTLQATGVDMTPATTNFINVMPGPAAELAVTTQPPGAVAVDSTFGLTVSAEDIYGNVATSFNGSVVMALDNNPVNGALSGPTTVTAIQGIASFTGLMINTPSSDYTLQATSVGLTLAVTGALNVTHAATQLAVTSQPPGTVIAGSIFGLSVSVEDAFGDVVPSFNGLVTIPSGSDPGGGNLGGILTVTAVDGVAAITGLSLDKEGRHMLQVISSGLTPTTTGALNVTPGPVAQLVVTAPPPLTTTAGTPFGLTVSAQDIYGNVETSFYGNITIAPVQPTPAPSGALTTTASEGVAAFTGLVLHTAGSGYTLEASGDGLTTTTSSFSVTPAPATRLVVTGPPPGTLSAGSPFGLTVSFEDAFGNLATTFNGSVTVALATAPGGGALSGTTTVTATQGVAAFTGLALDMVGTGYTLQVSSGVLNATTDGLNVTPAPAAELAVTIQPPVTTAAGDSFGLTVSVDDAFGNLTTTFNGSVTVALAMAPGGAVISGTTTITAVQGVAAFSGLALDTAGVGYTLQATAVGMTPATTTLINVTPGKATQLAVTTQPPGAVAVDSSFGLTASAEDTYGNVDTSFNGSVTVGLASNPVNGTLGGMTTVTAVQGIAAFGGLTINTPSTDYTLQAISSDLPPTTTGAFNVTAPATQLVVTSQPPTSVGAGSSFRLTVSAEDALGNLATNFNGNVTIALASDPGGGALSGTTTVTAVRGVAAFSGLTLDTAGIGYTFQVISSGLTSTTTGALNVTPVPAAHPVGYTPPQILAAYGINQVMFGPSQGDGSGQTIALVDAYDDPNISTDLAQFDQEFNQPDPASFTVLNQYGSEIGSSSTGPRPATDPTGAWEATEALDVEWAHSIAPAASIILIECNSASPVDLFTGVTTAKNLPGVSVISIGGGFGEDTSLPIVDNALTTPSGHQGVTFVAPTGDLGSPGWYPAYSSNVVAVGGTSLTLNPLDFAAPYGSEQGWSDSGGGTSQYETEPAYQEGVQTTGFRTIPDVSFDADPSTGVAIYDSYNNGSLTPWVQVGGTSLSASCWAGLIAIADQARVAAGGTTLDGPSQTLPALYSLPASDFHDGLGGDNGTNTDGLLDPARYDEVTGLGTPQANVLVSDLASYELASQLVVTSQPPSSVSAGDPFGITVTVEYHFGDVETAFNGSVTVAFGSNPGAGPLRGTFIATATNGVATFHGLSIDTAGTGYTLQVTGLGMTPATTTLINVTHPPTATQLVVTSQPPTSVGAGSGFGLTVSVDDASGSPVPSFNGDVTVALANNPGAADLGGTLTVTVVNGVAAFTGLTINTAGTGYSIQVISNGLTSTTTGAVNVTSSASQPANQRLAIFVEPGPVATGSYFLVTVDVENSLGVTETNFAGSVTLALASNPGGATLGGNLTLPVSDGQVTFYGLTLNVAGSGYTIQATSSLIAAATTSPITVVNPPATQLVVTAQPPASVAANRDFGLTVAVVDASGNLVSSFNGSVTVALVGKPGGGKLHGTLTVTATNGVATFSGLTLTKVRKGYKLRLTASGLTPAATSAFKVAPVAARRLSSTPHPYPSKLKAHTIIVKTRLRNGT